MKTEQQQTNKNAGKNLGDLDYTVEESRTVPDGAHVGTIVKAELMERGEEGFRYVDVHVLEGASGVTLKVGYPASKVTPETELGRLLRRFGAPIKVGEAVRPVSVLNHPDMKVAFETETEKNKNGRFARILPESLRPLQ